jgi:transcriptional regulator with XRE-family HTH domain
VAHKGRRNPGTFGISVATVIDNERRDQGLSQKALGDMVGISQNQLSPQLGGKTPITVDELHALATALGLATSEIINAAEALDRN